MKIKMDLEDMIEALGEWYEMHAEEGSSDFTAIDNVDSLTFVCNDL